jgi:guanylate kinase
MNKLILVAAPSGAGKTTIVHHLLEHFDELAFSVSATTRPKRPDEKEGEDYYFLHPGEFKNLIEEGAFIEWEEVYENQFYGTLRREVERLWQQGKSIIFDIDVKGALNIKKIYPEESLTIFVKPPSLKALRQRLSRRQTEAPEDLQKRMEHAEKELRYENMFDRVILNDDLAKALREAEAILDECLHSRHE